MYLEASNTERSTAADEFSFRKVTLKLSLPSESSGSEVKSLSSVRLFVTPETVARQAPLSWDSPGKNT